MTTHKFRVEIICNNDSKTFDWFAVDFRQAAKDAIEYEAEWLQFQADMNPVIKVTGVESGVTSTFQVFTTFHLV